jgi:hypoxanthine-DNA glycosylase
VRAHPGFPPIEGASAHTLILGTMPGAASLAVTQYYAHPRNAFWTILADLVGFDPQLDYVARTQRLVDAGIAVWDVLRSCERRGSLDSEIDRTSVVANDFDRFFNSIRTCVGFSSMAAMPNRSIVDTCGGRWLQRNHQLSAFAVDEPGECIDRASRESRSVACRDHAGAYSTQPSK